MKLEKFKKYGKRNKKIICSVIGIIILIGGFILFTSFAFFESKYDFDVIKGRIPSYWYDMKIMSVKLDGVEQKEIPDRGLYKVNVGCANGSGEWDYNSWSLKLNNMVENTKCNLEFTQNLTQAELDKYIKEGVAHRRNTYRGEDLTNKYFNNETNEAKFYKMISDGTFDDIYVGV